MYYQYDVRERLCPCLFVRMVFACVVLALTVLLSAYPASAQVFSATSLGDFGNVTVMEVDGNYDSLLPDGTVNTVPRRSIAREFFRTHQDIYDFLIIFTSFDFQMPQSGSLAFYHPVKNDISGIGQEVFDNSSLYGSSGKLQGTVDMGLEAMSAIDPANADGYDFTLNTLSHEILHRWSAFVQFKDDAGNLSDALLGKDGSHWSYLLDTDASLEYGNDWRDNGDGTFVSVGSRSSFSSLDLYLMGMIDKTEVPPMLLIDNPRLDPTQLPRVGDTITGVGKTVRVEQIVAAMGERVPSASEAQKSFNGAFVFITRPGTFNQEDLYSIEKVRNGFLTRFSILTDGEALVHVTPQTIRNLPTNPGIQPPSTTPRTVLPRVEDGVNWLLSHQNEDGSWFVNDQTAERDTAESVVTLDAFVEGQNSRQRGVGWLTANPTSNTDYLARRIEAIVTGGGSVPTLVDTLAGRQNLDGGWGLNRGFVSNPADTGLALKALSVAGFNNQTNVGPAVAYLQRMQNEDGGWGSMGSKSLIQPTAHTLLALHQYDASNPSGTAIQQGANWLTTKQNGDGGFGNSPSTVYDSAAAVLALTAINEHRPAASAGIGYLLNSQGEDGSWNASPYQTAAAVKAIWTGAIDPDLSVRTEDITFIPERIDVLPSSVVVGVTLYNNSRTDIPLVNVDLYDGEIATENLVERQQISAPGLTPVQLTFNVSLEDGAEHAFVAVVDPDEQIIELDEENNQAVRVLQPAQTYDFKIVDSVLALSTAEAVRTETLTVDATITNRGTRSAFGVAVRLVLDGASPRVLDSVLIDIPAGGSVTQEFRWHTDMFGTDLPLKVEIDPQNQFDELDEDNNSASAVLTVLVAPTEADLMVESTDIVFDPATVTYLPIDVQARVTLHNLGRTDVSQARVVLYEGEIAVANLIGDALLDLPAETAQTINFPLHIEDGERHLLQVVVDPDNLVTEWSETNNQATNVLVPAETYDLVIVAGSVSVSPEVPTVYEPASIRARIKNSGTRNVYNAQVRFAAEKAGISFDIATLTVDVPAGQSILSEVPWTPLVPGAEIALHVTADPFNLLPESDETNNQNVQSVVVIGSSIADLQTSYRDLEVDPYPANERGTATIRANINNVGFAAVDNLVVDFYLGAPEAGGELLGREIIAHIEPGQSGVATFLWSDIPESGNRIIYIVVDPDAVIPELDESNNDAFTTVEILSLPDLMVTPAQIEIDPPMPKDGDQARISVTVLNRGGQGAENVQVLLLVDGQPVATQVLPLVAGQASAKTAFFYDTTGRSGFLQLSVVVDGDDLIVEQSEDNNSAEQSFAVQNANLWVTETYISPNGDNIQDRTDIYYRLDAATIASMVVEDDQGNEVRSLGGSTLSAAAGRVTWDGLDAAGSVVLDGEYRIRLFDQNASPLSEVRVVVDNNRSLLTDAVRTDSFLVNNLTCTLPDISWQLFPDESGLLFEVADNTAPGFPKGLYTMSGYGDDLFSILPHGWTNSDGIQVADFELSPDGERVAVLLERFVPSSGLTTSFELWTLDSDGENLEKLDTLSGFNAKSYGELFWSPDSRKLVYAAGRTPYFSIYAINVDGSGRRFIDTVNAYHRSSYPHLFGGVYWAPSGNAIAYQSRYSGIYVNDLAGQKKRVSSLWWYSISMEWLNDEQFFYSRGTSSGIYSSTDFWLIDATDAGNNQQLTGRGELFVRHPTDELIVFVSSEDKTYLKQVDASGTVITLYTTANMLEYGEEDDDDDRLSILDVSWSDDGSKLAFVDLPHEEVESCTYQAHLVVIDPTSGEKNSYPISTPAGLCGWSTDYDRTYQIGSLHWLGDAVHLVAGDEVGTFIINSATGEQTYLPAGFDGLSTTTSELRKVSSSGNQLYFRERVATGSPCYGTGAYDLWSISTTYNLSVSLRIIKDRNAVILNAVAVDRHFSSYSLEYADVNDPDTWSPIRPISSVPLSNAIAATWIPPYDGTFFVRLTARDKAGNEKWNRKKVSWNTGSRIDSFFKTEDIISPNGDGNQDFVELYYRAVEPIHLEFAIYNEAGGLVRSYLREHALPGTGFIHWDGRDESGQSVPDGQYSIRVFDFEFFVEIDNTPPLMAIELQPLKFISGDRSLLDQFPYRVRLFRTSDLKGMLGDLNLKEWRLETGHSKSPDSWAEVRSGEEGLGAGTVDGLLETRQLASILTSTFPGDATDRNFRLTAKDQAGNTASVVSRLPTEELVLLQWDNTPAMICTSNQVKPCIPESLLPAALVAGKHHVLGVETVRNQFDSLTLQYQKDDIWFDANIELTAVAGTLQISWDILPELGLFSAVRLHGVDQAGREFLSNSMKVTGTIVLKTSCSNPFIPVGEPVSWPKASLDQNLWETINKITLQIRPSGSSSYQAYQVIEHGPDWNLRQPEIILPSRQGVYFSGEDYDLKVQVDTIEGTQYEVSGQLPSRDSDRCPQIRTDNISIVLSPEYSAVETCNEIADQVVTFQPEVIVNQNSYPLSYLKALGYQPREIRFLILNQGVWTEFRQDDLTSGINPAPLVYGTDKLPEGNHANIRADLRLQTPAGEIFTQTLLGKYVVDRTLPLVRITYPSESQQVVCPVKIGERNGIGIEGQVSDNLSLADYQLFVDSGDTTDGWQLFDYGKQPLSGQLGLLGVEEAPESHLYFLRLKADDRYGNRSCQEISVQFDTQTAIAFFTADRKVISPNSDGISDDISLNYQIDEYAKVDIEIRNLIESTNSGPQPGEIVYQSLLTERQHQGGVDRVVWDGRDAMGRVLPDGRYAILLRATDGCDNVGERWFAIEIDNTAPVVAILQPLTGRPLAMVVEVEGSVLDPNLKNYTLDVQAVDAATSLVAIANGVLEQELKVLGVWNTFEQNGQWILRLAAEDTLGNRSETTVTLDLNPRITPLKALSVTPQLISPNQDGLRDSTEILFDLTEPGMVDLKIIDSQEKTVRQFAVLESSAGEHLLAWDGRDADGVVVEDGEYIVQMRVALLADPDIFQTETVSLSVDTAAPTIEILQPSSEAFRAEKTLAVTGTIEDASPLDYTITLNSGAVETVLAQGSGNRTNEIFAHLTDLTEQNYSVTVSAKDEAENSATVTHQFTIDRTPPVVFLKKPAPGSFWGIDNPLIEVTGSVSEEHFDNYRLQYGAGENPTQWTELQSGEELSLANLQLQWQIGALNQLEDGVYTLWLQVRDKAGLEGEARVTLEIDKTPPLVAITAPLDGEYISGPVDIDFTVDETNFGQAVVELAEGQCDSTDRWAPLELFSDNNQAGLHSSWQSLPADGPYCLRLRAEDAAGNASETIVNVGVDTQPPQAPLFSGQVENRSAAKLNWVSAGEPDLAGYDLYRSGQHVNGPLLLETSFLDPDLEEGAFTYTVRSVDLAGNQSEDSNPVDLLIDVTGPEARIILPRDGDRVGDLFDIKGMAYSQDDFREYRLNVSVGSTQDSWHLLRQSPLATSYDVLGRWDALGFTDGIYRIKLEAEDLSGNVTVDEIEVFFDSTPPQSPVLVSADLVGEDVSLEWQTNGEIDLAGYLLFRNEQLVNAFGVIVTDWRPYLIKGSNFSDSTVPDGSYQYYLLAIDQAGNLSSRSNSLIVDIDRRAPQALIVDPIDGALVDVAIEVHAETADRDVASLLFQYKSVSAADWIDLSSPLQAPPYVVTFDPRRLGLVHGAYQLRAVALDLAGAVDPAPVAVGVTYTDLTSPAPPAELQAQTNGDAVTLKWDANSEDDLAGYQVYRRKADAWGGWYSWARLNTAVLADSGYIDATLADGNYAYRISAVDSSGNESVFTQELSARVYAPLLVQPFTPVRESKTAIAGSNAEPQALVELFCETAAGVRSVGRVQTDATGNFLFDNLLLESGANIITAVATDAEGNVSRISAVATVFRNAPPAPPRGLTGLAVDFDVVLAWQANLEVDLAGYNIYRDGRRVNQSVLIDSATTSASDSSYLSSNARDGDISTSWQGYRWGHFLPFWFELEMTASELVEVLEIDWYPSVYSGRDFEVLAWTGDAWISLATVVDNEQNLNRLVFDQPYRTDRIRISITESNDPGYNDRYHVGIGEIRLYKENLISAPSFNDQNLGNHEYRYNVSAVDYLGFESSLSDEVTIGLGDWIPPAPSENLSISAPAKGQSLRLDWGSQDAKSVSYTLYRAAESSGPYQQVNASPIAQTHYLDSGLMNGTRYFYTVAAVDFFGNVGAQSLAASGVPVDLEAPDAPVLIYPATPAKGKVVTERLSKIIGMVEPGTQVELLENGIFKGATTSLKMPQTTTIQFEFESYEAQLSPDGRYFSYTDQLNTSGSHLLVRELSTGITTIAGENVSSYVWATDESKIIYYYQSGAGVGRLGVFDIDSGEISDLTENIGVYEDYPSMSDDGNLIAYISSLNGYEDLWIKDLNRGLNSQLSAGRKVIATAVSPGGTKVAYYDDYTSTSYIADLVAGTIIEVDNNSSWRGLDWSPDGRRLAFLSSSREAVFTYDVETGVKTQIVNTPYAKHELYWSPDSSRIVFDQMETDGSESIRTINLQGQESLLVEGLESLTFLRWQKTGEIAYLDSNELEFNILRPSGYFEFNEVELHPGENQFYVSATDDAGHRSPTSESITIIYDTSQLPDPAVVSADISVYPLLPHPGDRVSVNTTVRNLSATPVVNVSADIYLWEAPDNLILLESKIIDYLDAQGTATVASSFVVSGQSADYSIIVLLDPAGLHDELSESNNYATRDVHVMSAADIQLFTQLDGAEYGIDQSVAISVDMFNAGPALDATLQIMVEDEFGNQVSAVEDRTLNLPYGTNGMFFQWNTGETFAGSYVVHSVLRDAQRVVAEASQPFVILPDRSVALSAAVGRPSYGPGDLVSLEIAVENTGKNFILPSLLVRTEILNSQQSVVFSSDKVLHNLLPGVLNALVESWNVEQTVPGTYRAVVETFLDGELLTSASTAFVANPVIQLVGSVSVDPQSVIYGVDFTTPYSVHNNGNLSADGLLKVSMLDPETLEVVGTQEKAISIPVSGNASGQLDFGTSALGLNTYRARMHFADSTGERLINEAIFVVVDGQSPTISIQSPTPNETYRQVVDIEVVAQDDISGVESVFYRLDFGDWQRVPSANLVSGRYLFTWTPTLADNGSHSIEFLVQDRAGNSTQTDKVPFDLQMDITPPVTLLEVEQPYYAGNDGTGYLAEASRLNLLAADDLSGVATTEYRFDSGDWKLYVGSISLVSLPDGEHVVGFRSIDALGNKEAEKLFNFVIDNTVPVTMILVDSTQYANNGSLYISAATVVSLSATDQQSGVARIEYQIDNGSWIAYEPFTLGGMSDGEHTVGFRSQDNLTNVEITQMLTVLVDNTLPQTYLSINGIQYGAGDVQYVAKESQFVLSSSDNLSGVARTEYRIDESDWAAYAPFSMAGLSDGRHLVGCRSVDNLNNVEIENVIEVVVDNHAPLTDISVDGPQYRTAAGSLFVSRETRFSLVADDELSGVALTDFRVNGASWSPYLPFDLSGMGEGDVDIDFRSIDNLGHLEIEKSLKVSVDNTPPTTSIAFNNQSYMNGDQLLVSRRAEVSLSAIDSLAGVAETSYRFDDQADWNRYQGVFSLDALGFGTHLIHFRSVDHVINMESEQTVEFVLVGIDSDISVVNVPRVLVWLGEEDKVHWKHKEDSDDDDHDERDNHDDDEGRGAGCKTDGSRQDALDFLTDAFAGQDVYFQVVTTETDYLRAFRSGVFNLTLILDEDLPFGGNFVPEFIEGVRRGMGLLFAPGKSNGDSRLQDLLGVKFEGSLSRNSDQDRLQLYESPISGEAKVGLIGTVLKSELAGGELVALIPGEGKRQTINRLTLRLPVESHEKDLVKVTLLKRHGNERDLVDEEWLSVEDHETKLVNQNLGNVYGDLSLSSHDDGDVELHLNSKFGAFEDIYELDVTLVPHDGGRTISILDGLELNWNNSWSVGAPIGVCRVKEINGSSKRSSQDLPGVVLHQFGEGRTSFLAFDLVASAKSSDRSTYLALIQNALQHLLTTPSVPQAASTELLETVIKLSGNEMDLIAVENLWPGLTYKPLFDLRQKNLEYHLSFIEGDEVRYRYFVQSTDQAGTYGKTTKIQFLVNGAVTSYDSYPYSFDIEKGSERLLQDSIAWLDGMILLSPSGTGNDGDDDHGRDDEKDHDRNNGLHKECRDDDEGEGGDSDNDNRFRELREKMIKIGLMNKRDEKELDKVIDKVLHVLSKFDKLSVGSSEPRVWMSDYLRIMEVKYDLSGGYQQKKGAGDD